MSLREKQALLRSLVFWFSIFEGVWFWVSLLGPIQQLSRLGFFKGGAKQFSYIARDESNHIGFGVALIREFMAQYPEALTDELLADIDRDTRRAIELEQGYISYCLDGPVLGYSIPDHIAPTTKFFANMRLGSVGLPTLRRRLSCVSWMSEQMELKKEKNFFNFDDNNICGSVALFQAMAEAGVFRLVFSSSATVYGDPHSVPIREDFPLQATNPYGRSKLIIEDMLRDASQADSRWRVALLRYFNPVGAHPSGIIGEDPQGIPNNLMPYVTQVAVGRRSELLVFGGDYPTPDGTGVRDYIHVVDLARGHLAALKALDRLAGAIPINLGTGRGYSVLNVILSLEKASGRNVPFRIVNCRPGDVATCYADPSLARRLLGWSAKKDIAEMCEDSWRWQSNNPNGFCG